MPAACQQGPDAGKEPVQRLLFQVTAQGLPKGFLIVKHAPQAGLESAFQR